MCKTISFLLFFFPFSVFGQVDSAVVKTVDSLLQVALTLTDQQDFKSAFEINGVAEKMALEKYGRESIAYANACFGHGNILYRQGSYPESEKWQLEAKDIREKILGNTHPKYAESLNGLASLYWATGSYEKAELLFLETISVQEKTLGKENKGYGVTLYNLANLYQDIGEYEKAEPLNQAAKSIFEKTLGKEHPYYAASIFGLGNLYMEMGNYEKAEPLYLEARDLNEKTSGKDNADYAMSLNNLAILHKLKGDFTKSESLYIQAKTIYEKALGNMHPEYAKSLNNLANLYSTTGNYTKAEPLYIEAIAIREKTLGKQHPSYARSLNTLGRLYVDMGNYAKASPLLLEALALRENLLGKTHYDYATSLENLAYLYWASGNFDHAERYLAEVGELEKKLVCKAAFYQSERELSWYIKKMGSGFNWDFSFAQIQPNMSAICYNDLLFYKGYLQNAASQINRITQSDTAGTRKYYVFQDLQRRLAAEYSKPIAKQKNVVQLEENVNNLEKDLVRSVAGLGEVMRQVNWKEVQQNLHPNEAAIEFVRYNFIHPQPTDSIMYAALVLKPGSNQPVFIPLFEEKQLDQLLQNRGKTKADYINDLYAADPTHSLYQLIWQPLEQQLTGIKTIYFAPAGLLYRLNPGAIIAPPLLRGNEEMETIASRYHLVELGSTRQLAIPTATAANGASAVLYGGIQYDLDSIAITRAVSDLNANSLSNPRGLSFSSTDSTLRGGTWGYLKWTDIEVSATAAMLNDAGLQPAVRKGSVATEESFKTIGVGQPSPRILHIATHGFFFPDPENKGQISSSNQQDQVFKLSDHPMIRSGLILAGGNYAWQKGKPYRSDREDGILTAYEISQMNLRNTELVVLSACETGLGDIQGNEGVYGLQRAFKIAGVKYLIMSLWQVPDFQTQELMAAFYSKWLIEKMTIPNAFSSAQKAMREKYKDPVLWAGFILVE